VRCPSCGARQGWFEPWRALSSEAVKCAGCEKPLVLSKSSSSIRTHIAIGSVIASLVAGAFAVGANSFLGAVAAFLLTEIILAAYLYMGLFDWKVSGAGEP
jgi:hypothetical protein